MDVQFESKSVRIEASQKGWLAARALLELMKAIVAVETGEANWDGYFSAKGEALLALRAFETWHGEGVRL